MNVKIPGMAKILDSIYLNKRGHHHDDGRWIYYRVTSSGHESDSIEVCLVEWPTFRDINVAGDEFKAIVVNPADSRHNSASPNLHDLLKSKWNIHHFSADLVGVIVREV
jgi:hypothetical protein